MTVQELIARLTAVRDTHGPSLRVLVDDGMGLVAPCLDGVTATADGSAVVIDLTAAGCLVVTGDE